MLRSKGPVGGGPLGPEVWQQANVNELTDCRNQDASSGFPVFRALLCDIELVDAEVMGASGTHELTPTIAQQELWPNTVHPVGAEIPV